MSRVDDAIRMFSEFKKLRSAYRRLGWKSRLEGRSSLYGLAKRSKAGTLTDPPLTKSEANFILDAEAVFQALEKVLGK